MKRSGRAPKPNSKYFSDDIPTEGPRRKCTKTDCLASVPICFARVSDRCCGNGQTSRWYHVTVGEHYCNECFEYFYRSHKDGNDSFSKWKRVWSMKSRTPASLNLFMTEEILPFWVQCRLVGCGKWRQLSRDLDLSPDFIDSFQCGASTRVAGVKKEKIDACRAPEDDRVQLVHSPVWLLQSKVIPYLKKSPSTPFLTSYYADGVGNCPTDEKPPFLKHHKKNLCPYVVPFPKGDNPLHAFALNPDMMSADEIEHMPVLAQECPYMYLAIRNLIMVLWAMNPKEWVSQEACVGQIICRGLARISCIQLLPKILSYLTNNNFINVGLLRPPLTELVPHNTQGQSVLVIGAGISGLGAAHLLRARGVQVTVLEAKSRLGGRIHDLDIDGTVVSSSGQMVNGCVNNPIAIMAYQAGVKLHVEGDYCKLITESGKFIEDSVDRRIEFHCNAILDIVSEWRKNKSDDVDIGLLTKFKELHQEFVSETQNCFSKEEEQVMEFYLANLEFACGCSLSDVSSLQWDHNEEFSQFMRPNMSVAEGFGSILAKLAEDLDIRTNCEVMEIDYTGDQVTVKTATEQFTADKVILTLPLGVLKSGHITFHPPLPQAKVKAIESLGAGRVEKVVLQFDHNFWSEKVRDYSNFGHVPAVDSQRGVFPCFSQTLGGQAGHFLSTYLVGNGVSLMEDESDTRVVETCLALLRDMFHEQTVPEPTWSQVTHWGRDPHCGMSYSFVPVGASGNLYDLMAEDVEGKIFFAGEATHRQFPQTVAGAYLSGVREARKLIRNLTEHSE